jgi:hypothetical protein
VKVLGWVCVVGAVSAVTYVIMGSVASGGDIGHVLLVGGGVGVCLGGLAGVWLRPWQGGVAVLGALVCSTGPWLILYARNRSATEAYEAVGTLLLYLGGSWLAVSVGVMAGMVMGVGGRVCWSRLRGRLFPRK